MLIELAVDQVAETEQAKFLAPGQRQLLVAGSHPVVDEQDIRRKMARQEEKEREQDKAFLHEICNRHQQRRDVSIHVDCFMNEL